MRSTTVKDALVWIGAGAASWALFGLAAPVVASEISPPVYVLPLGWPLCIVMLKMAAVWSVTGSVLGWVSYDHYKNISYMGAYANPIVNLRSMLFGGLFGLFLGPLLRGLARTSAFLVVNPARASLIGPVFGVLAAKAALGIVAHIGRAISRSQARIWRRRY